MPAEKKGLGITDTIVRHIVKCRADQGFLKDAIRPVFGEKTRDMVYGITGYEPQAKARGLLLAYLSGMHAVIQDQQKQIDALTAVVMGASLDEDQSKGEDQSGQKPTPKAKTRKAPAKLKVAKDPAKPKSAKKGAKKVEEAPPATD